MITLAYFIAIIIVLYIVYKILAAVGLIKTPAKKREENEEASAMTMIRTDEYFDPLYIQKNNLIGQHKSLGANAGIQYAQDLRAALKGAGTDEEAVFTTFGKLYNKINVSEVSGRYLVQYNRDLRTDLLNDLSASEVTTLMNIINGLPDK